MLRVRRRGATRTVSALLAALLSATLDFDANDLRRPIHPTNPEEISQLSAALSQEEKTSEITANQYDADEAALSSINANIVSLQSQESKKLAAIAVTSSALAAAIVKAYVFGSADAQILSLFNQDVTRSDARTVFEDEVIGNLHKLKTTYTRQKNSLDTTISEGRPPANEGRTRDVRSQGTAGGEHSPRGRDPSDARDREGRLRNEIIAYEVQAGVAAAKAHNAAGEETGHRGGLGGGRPERCERSHRGNPTSNQDSHDRRSRGHRAG